VSEAHPVPEPGPASPAWATLPTMPLAASVPSPRMIPEAAAVPAVSAGGPSEAPSPVWPPGVPPVSAAPAPAPWTPAEYPPVDPEQILAGHEWRLDPETLREVIDADEAAELCGIRDLLTAKLVGITDNAGRARLLSLRAVVSRILGDPHQAFADGKLALAHAEATGELRRIAIAQARLAHVLQWRGDYAEADRLYELANSRELPDRLRAAIHQHAGRCAYDQGRYIEACNHFESALNLRHGEDPDLIAHVEIALDALFRRVAEHGWGPYPRTREELLGIVRPPEPALHPSSRRWGFVDANGDFVIGPGLLNAHPFHDGVAWVQPDSVRTWALIDQAGRVLIPPASGYRDVGAFADGLAWVSRDDGTGWIAIDKANTALISAGFDDARPFRRGVAAVCRDGRWGAVDRTGRPVVPLQFDRFTTATHDGRHVDGFTDDGLAVVSIGGREGVADRSGRVVVPPVHPTVVIHPGAFLILDPARRWGALDRHGRLLIEPSYPNRAALIHELDRMCVDPPPVL
jgi:tetratricopeptide (TPR) repeat protein